ARANPHGLATSFLASLPNVESRSADVCPWRKVACTARLTPDLTAEENCRWSLRKNRRGVTDSAGAAAAANFGSASRVGGASTASGTSNYRSARLQVMRPT